MVRGYDLKEFTQGQKQTYWSAVETYRDYLEALEESRVFKGSMHWKKIRGRDYLYRYRDRFGRGESLGPRSEDTEQLFSQFTRERREAAARLREERSRLAEQAGFCRAAKINRTPRTLARILGLLASRESGGDPLVIGTAALFAYEAAAGVFLNPAVGLHIPGPSGLAGFKRQGPVGEHPAAGQPSAPPVRPQPPVPPTSKNSITAAEASPERTPAASLTANQTLTLLSPGEASWSDLLHLLRRADRSFAPDPQGECRALNREGFLVRMLKTGARRPGKQKAVTVPGAREPLPPEAGNLSFLAAAAKFSQVVVGKDGFPATMVVADPRAFVLNKFWLSEQEDREPAKRARDLSQALAVAGLVLGYLPEYDFFSTELEMLPQDLVQSAAGLAEDADAAGED